MLNVYMDNLYIYIYNLRHENHVDNIDLVLNHFHASDYIFIMTHWESLLQMDRRLLSNWR